MKRLHFLLALPLFVFLFHSCQKNPATATATRYELPATDPDAASMDAAMFAKMDSISQAMVDEGKLPSIETMVIRSGKIVHTSRIGYEDLAKTKPLGANKIYRLASMTNCFSNFLPPLRLGGTRDFRVGN